MKRGILAVLTALWLLPSGASAQNLPQGFYVEGRGGANFADDAEVEDEPSGFVDAGGDIDIELDTGWLVTGAVGYASSIGWRVEIEGGYRENELDELELSGIGPSTSADLDGDAEVFTGMANVFFDFDPSLYGLGDWIVIPFGGVGVGAARVEFDDVGTGDDEDDVGFAYQLMGGLSVLVTDQITLSVMYTYLDTDELDLDDVELDYESHSVQGGIRFTF